MKRVPQYVVHETGYERDGYILQRLLAHPMVVVPLNGLRRTTWHLCWVRLDELQPNGEVQDGDRVTVERLARRLERGEPMEPVLILGAQKQLISGHQLVAALHRVGAEMVLAYHGEWLDSPEQHRRASLPAVA